MTPAEKLLKRETSGDSNIVALLSLKLLLLAFFILLSTMSNFEEERTQAVMESVVTTFQGKLRAVDSYQPTDAGLDVLEGARPALADQIESLFKATLPAVEMEKSSDGKVLRLEAPASSLFVVNSTALAPGRGVLMQRLVNALTSEQGTLEFFDLQFLHTAPGEAALGTDSLAVLRSGVVVRTLEDRGLDPANIAAGIQPVPAEDAARPVIIFEIRVHDEEVRHGGVEQEGPPR